MSLFYVNRATLLGNVSKNADLKITQNGNAVLNFSLATNHSVKKGEQWEDIPTFHNIVFWGKLAEKIAPRLVKGVKVYVEGRIDYRKYEKDGQTKYFTEIVAERVIEYSPKGNNNTNYKQDNEVREPNIEKEDEIDLDDIPF